MRKNHLLIRNLVLKMAMKRGEKTKKVTLPTGGKKPLCDTLQGQRQNTHTQRRRGGLPSPPHRRGPLAWQALQARLVGLIYTGTQRMVWRLWACSAKRPCVHEIRMSTSDSCCQAVTVKQIMSVGGNCNISLSR